VTATSRVPLALWMSALLGACLPDFPVRRFPSDPTDDWDGDGEDEVHGDCDDRDPAISTAAAERCDEVDNDCDDRVDDADDDVEPSTQVLWFADADGDHWGDSSRAGRSCAPPSMALVAEAAGDCDDTDPEVHPEAEERCGNGLDDDCDGGPGDCGWEQEETLESATLSLVGSESGQLVGDGLESLGDIDGDGRNDVLIGAVGASGVGGEADAGGVWLVTGAELQAMAEASTGEAVGGARLLDEAAGLSLRGTAENGLFGIAATRTDRALGEPGFAVGARCEYPCPLEGGRVYLFGGLTPGAHTAEEAEVELAAAAIGDLLGVVLSTLGGDLVAPAPGHADAAGRVYLVREPPSGTHALDPLPDCVVSTVDGVTEGDYFGEALSGLADLDGDGVADLVVGAPAEHVGGETLGGLHVFLGPLAGSVRADDADHIVIGPGADSLFGRSFSVGDDLDQDGIPDLVVAAEEAAPHGEGEGVVYLLDGGSLGTGPTAVEAITSGRIEGGARDPAVGRSVATLDFNGDGAPDIAVGSTRSGEGRGVVATFNGPFSAGGWTLTTTDADQRFSGLEPEDRLGRSILGAGDINLDGLDDLLLGAPEKIGVTPSGAGAVYLFPGAEGI
jgi:hypothetical protein